MVHDIAPVDAGFWTEEVHERYHARRQHEPSRVKRERTVRVHIHAVQHERVVDVFAAYLNAQVSYQPCRVEVDELAFMAVRRYLRGRNACGVLGRIEICSVRGVREMDGHVHRLRRLIARKVDVHIMDFGVQVREFQRVVDRGDTVVTVRRLQKRKLPAQVDGVIPRRGEIVEVENERLQDERQHEHDNAALRNMLHRILVYGEGEAQTGPDVVKRRWHDEEFYRIRTGRE